MRSPVGGGELTAARRAPGPTAAAGSAQDPDHLQASLPADEERDVARGEPRALYAFAASPAEAPGPINKINLVGHIEWISSMS